MKNLTSKNISFALALLFLLTLMLPVTASATGPRVTKALFGVDKTEIHVLDFPPFLSNEVADGGPFSEIVNQALQEAGIDAVISTHPVQRIVRYYLLQENALAVMGWHLNFSSKAKEGLIFLPVAVMVEKFYYYKPFFLNGLNWNGKLTSLKGKTYAANKGEDVAAYKAAGITVKYARTVGLLKMIAAGKADFTAIPALTADWLIAKYMSAEKANFAVMDRPAGDNVFYMIFNKRHPQGEASAAAFRKALSGMVNDGRYAKIMKKHLGNDEVLKLYMGDIKERLAR